MIPTANVNSFLKLSVPRPVTTSISPIIISATGNETKGALGSRPTVALKPSVPRPGLLPIVIISFNPVARPIPYSRGFKKPIRGVDPCIVQHGNKGRKGGSGVRCAKEQDYFTLIRNQKVPGLRSYVGIPYDFVSNSVVNSSETGDSNLQKRFVR